MSTPTLIIGMHRSGTTLLSKCLEEAGWYGGWRKEANNESTFFLRMNDWLLSNCVSDWELERDIEPDLLAHFDVMHTVIKECNNSILYNEYLPFFKNKGECWGFKDPRTSLTLPFWLKYYGKVRLIHIRRHGIDVAQSLIHRKKKNYQSSNHSFLKLAKRFYLKEKLKPTMKLKNINDAVSLWFHYESLCEKYLSENDSISIQYEELLASPLVTLKNIFTFLGLEVSEEKLIQMSNKFNSDRAFSYRKKGLVEELNEDSISMLKRLNYEV